MTRRNRSAYAGLRLPCGSKALLLRTQGDIFWGYPDGPQILANSGRDPLREQRGLLDHTLVIWGGEFGRTPMGEGSGIQ